LVVESGLVLIALGYGVEDGHAEGGEDGEEEEDKDEVLHKLEVKADP
jgi:hypothetical protein